jgi:hypothetical protein
MLPEAAVGPVAFSAVYFPEVKEILGRPVVRDMTKIQGEVDILDVFRRPQDLPQVRPVASGQLPGFCSYCRWSPSIVPECLPEERQQCDSKMQRETSRYSQQFRCRRRAAAPSDLLRSAAALARHSGAEAQVCVAAERHQVCRLHCTAGQAALPPGKTNIFRPIC